MKNLICILNGHKDFYQTAYKYHLSEICIRCKKPAYKNEQGKILRIIQLSRSEFAKDWDITECINSCEEFKAKALLKLFTELKNIGK